jgi:polygalacturonase
MKRLKMKINFFLMSPLLLTVLYSTKCSAQSTSDNSIDRYTTGLPFTMPKIELPNIPDRMVKISDFGAVGDGRTMNTDAIASAIQQSAKNGGGVVDVPSGMWLTGPIRLESNIELRLETGAVILFSKKFEDYPLFKRPINGYRCVPMIYGENLENFAITGKGIIDGNGQFWRPVKKEKMTSHQWKALLASGGVVSEDGKMWWPSKEAMNGADYLEGFRKSDRKPSPEEISKAREFLRPVMVAFDNCKRVLIDGPTFANSPAWTLAPTQSEDVVVRNISVNNPWWGQNTDGIDINSCHEFLLYNSVFSDGDDAICLKPEKPDEQHQDQPSCEDVVIADCTVYHGHGGFVIGSTTYGGAKNISVKNCIFIGTDVGLRFKSSKGRGGLVEKVYVDGIRMKDISSEAILFDLFYSGDTGGAQKADRTPQFQDMHVRNVVCDGASDAVVIRGLPEMPVKDISFDSITINSTRSCLIQDADAINMNDCTLSFIDGPVYAVNNASGIALQAIAFPKGTPLFLEASGQRTNGIVISHTNISDAKQELELGEGVPQNAVVVQ